jgi:hypothetical protein
MHLWGFMAFRARRYVTLEWAPKKKPRFDPGLEKRIA